MADKKISALTAATTPLAGTEVLPIVQGGATVKVPNNDLRPKQIQSNATSGVLQVVGPAAAATRVMTTPDANFSVARTDAAQSFTGDQTLSTGNLIIGTAGKGIDFSADPSAAGMTSELLDDYEEGTWTPTLAFTSGSVTYITQLGTYTKIGNQVTVNFWIRVNTLSSPSGPTYVASLPFNSGGTGTRPAAALRVNNFALTGYCVAWLSTSTNAALLNDIQLGIAATIDGSNVVGNTEIGGSFTYLIA
jgi:hypothetical protein